MDSLPVELQLTILLKLPPADVKSMRLVCKYFRGLVDNEVISQCCTVRRLPLNRDGLAWLARTFSISQYVVNTAFRNAAASGNIVILEQLIQTFQLTKHSVSLHDAAESAARYGHLHVLRWLQDTFCIRYSTKEERKELMRLFRCAAAEGYPDILRWLKQKFNITDKEARQYGNAAFWEAADNGHLKVLKWLTQNFKRLKVHYSVDSTSSHNKNVREWLQRRQAW